jgi:competence protein ComGC
MVLRTMRPVGSKAKTVAMTFVEVLVVIAVVAILLMLAVPALDNRPTRAPSVQCSNNLRQLGVCLLVFAAEHHNKFPPQIPVTNGGSMELINNGSPAIHFKTVSNEVGEHFKMWTCPTDNVKTAATNYSSFDDRNVSYFLSMDAAPVPDPGWGPAP